MTDTIKVKIIESHDWYEKGEEYEVVNKAIKNLDDDGFCFGLVYDGRRIKVEHCRPVYNYGFDYISEDIRILATKYDIFKAVCETYDIDPQEALNNNGKRFRHLVEPRQVAITMMRCFLKSSVTQKFPMSWRECGEFFKKDHATAMHAAKVVQNLWDTDKTFKAKVSHLFGGRRPNTHTGR